MLTVSLKKFKQYRWRG